MSKKNIIKIAGIIIFLLIIYYLINYYFPIFISYLPKSSEMYKYIVFLEPYILKIIEGIIVIIAGLFIIRTIKKIIYNQFLRKSEKSTTNIVNYIIDIIFYLIIILIILSIFNINITNIILAGSIGGIIIGLAVQTIAQNILSGFLVTSSKTIKPNDAVSISSWIWGNPIIGKVEKISLLFTEVLTIYGNIVKIPNSAFLGNSIFQKLKDYNERIIYPLQVTVNADVDGNKLIDNVINILKNKRNNYEYNIIFSTKNGSTNVFNVIIKTSDINNLTNIIDEINKAFDQAYWEIKNK